jgi:hypothetical protein
MSIRPDFREVGVEKLARQVKVLGSLDRRYRVEAAMGQVLLE